MFGSSKISRIFATVKEMRTPLIVTKGRESGNTDSTQEHLKTPERSPLKRSYKTGILNQLKSPTK